jgi:hypothetical protein
LAYLNAHQGPDAAAEFSEDYRWAHGRGRALVLSGDKVKAKSAYQDFLALWKDADPEIPIFIQAKKEFSALN